VEQTIPADGSTLAACPFTGPNAVSLDTQAKMITLAGEAQGVLTLVGGIFTAVSLGLLMGSVWIGRVERGATALREQAIAAARTAPPSWATAATVQPAAVAPAGDQLVDKLDRLADLRDRGVLSAAEFEAQKARLLSPA
jgi:hypothetical protein